MLKNRSVPADTVLPHLVYRNVAEAIEWLSRAFGFVEHYRYGEPVQGAQMRLGNAWIMLSGARKDGERTRYLTVFIDDPAACCERASESKRMGRDCAPRS